jgi:hypothetical protein
MTLPKKLELHWQAEIINRWLNTPGLDNDANQALSEMLRDVKTKISKLGTDSSQEDQNCELRGNESLRPSNLKSTGLPNFLPLRKF